jgi:L-amino acid N-acyltransferase
MDPIYKSLAEVAVRAANEGDAEAIRAIRNRAVETSTALWTDAQQSIDEGRAWLADHLTRGSAFVADLHGEVLGFAVWAPWRDYDGYRHTVEDSIYVREDIHGLGIGTSLLPVLIDSAGAAGRHVMIADIEADNAPSVRLHRRFGFEEVGTVREVGTKFGRWLDLTIMRRPLQSPLR